MVIWLRSSHAAVGLGQDVLRAADVAELVELDGAAEQSARHAEALLADATDGADVILRDAEAAADELMQKARDEYEAAEQRGYEAGFEQALQEAHASLLERAASERAVLGAMRERLAGIVLRSVARVLGDADRDALFARIAADLSRDLEAASYLAIRVAPDDFEAAALAFRRVCDEHRWPLNPAVTADADLEPGSCVCEWDHGVLETGLPMQLRALEGAVRAALVAAGEGGEGGEGDQAYGSDDGDGYTDDADDADGYATDDDDEDDGADQHGGALS